jgi:outer membrane protein assembly factor BamB
LVETHLETRFARKAIYDYEDFKVTDRGLSMQRHISSVLLVIAACFAVAADWPQFRGPGGAGVGDERGLPATWSSSDNIVWRVKLPGPGTSSPIVVGKRVYLTCYSGYGLKPGAGDMNELMRHLLCIDRKSGKVLWTKDFKPALPESKYGPGGNESQHGYASSTPASDGKHLYLFLGKSGVYCLDLDGNQVWHASVGNGINGWGSSNSPVLFKDLVIINASIESGSLVGLDKKTGKEVWRAKNIPSSWNTPVLVDAPAGAAELVVSDDSAVKCFDPATGKDLWHVGGFNGYVCASVVAHNGVVYVVRSGAKGNNGALAIKAGGKGDVSDSHVLWRARGSSLVSSPVYHDGRLWWVAGAVFCLDAASGKEAVKPGRLTGGGGLYASPLLADGKLYIMSINDGGFVVDAAGLKQLAHNSFADDKSRVNASPIAHEGCVLLRTDQYLYCIGKR